MIEEGGVVRDVKEGIGRGVRKKREQQRKKKEKKKKKETQTRAWGGWVGRAISQELLPPIVITGQ
jgi:hypothetical protein